MKASPFRQSLETACRKVGFESSPDDTDSDLLVVLTAKYRLLGLAEWRIGSIN